MTSQYLVLASSSTPLLVKSSLVDMELSKVAGLVRVSIVSPGLSDVSALMVTVGSNSPLVRVAKRTLLRVTSKSPVQNGLGVLQASRYTYRVG